MVHSLCMAYQALPSAGGVLDQDMSFLRMHAVLSAASEEAEYLPSVEELIPMVTL